MKTLGRTTFNYPSLGFFLEPPLPAPSFPPFPLFMLSRDMPTAPYAAFPAYADPAFPLAPKPMPLPLAKLAALAALPEFACSTGCCAALAGSTDADAEVSSCVIRRCGGSWWPDIEKNALNAQLAVDSIRA